MLEAVMFAVACELTCPTDVARQHSVRTLVTPGHTVRLCVTPLRAIDRLLWWHVPRTTTSLGSSFVPDDRSLPSAVLLLLIAYLFEDARRMQFVHRPLPAV